MTGEEMAVKLAETEARSKSNTHRLDHLEKSTEAINRLATSVEVMAKEQKHQTEAIKEVKTDLSDLSGKVEKIEAEPGNRWKTLVEKVILLVTAAVVDCVRRVMETDGLNLEEAEKKIKKIDKRRADYFKYFTGRQWQDAALYDLCLNTGHMSEQKCVDIVRAYMEARFE